MDRLSPSKPVLLRQTSVVMARKEDLRVFQASESCFKLLITGCNFDCKPGVLQCKIVRLRLVDAELLASGQLQKSFRGAKSRIGRKQPPAMALHEVGLPRNLDGTRC